jgi:RNA polymerase sigma factor (sigma-70 family)
MENKDWLENHFRESRHRLLAIAYRMLGSEDEAEDAVQEAWIRLTRSESKAIENINGWLTTVVTRVCLDLLRSRKSRREVPIDDTVYEIPSEGSGNPEGDVLLADSVGPALLVLLDLLTPTERIAFVLHDLFDLSFEEIAPIINRSEMAARQLASRARRRIRGASAPNCDMERQKEVVSAFLALRAKEISKRSSRCSIPT